MTVLEFAADQILKDQKLSYFLTPGTYGYFLYIDGKEIALYLTIAALVPSVVMYVEAEIREDLGDFYFEVTPWLWVETALVAVWLLLTLNITYGYAAKVDWSRDLWIAALGFANFILVTRFVIDQIYSYKYSKYYLLAKRVKEADF